MDLDLVAGTIAVNGIPFGLYEDPGRPVQFDRGRVMFSFTDGVVSVAGPHELILDSHLATCDGIE